MEKRLFVVEIETNNTFRISSNTTTHQESAVDTQSQWYYFTSTQIVTLDMYEMNFSLNRNKNS